MTQTADGYLWIGTEAGLVRFDGARFVPWVAPSGTSLPSATIYSLLGARNGGLWIGTAAGLAYWKGRELVNYLDTTGRINAIVEDREGTVWVARSRVRDSKGPLCRVKGGAVRCYGTADGISFPWAEALLDDGAGGVWVGTASAVCHWTPGSVRSYSPSRLNRADGSTEDQALARIDGETLLVGVGQVGSGLGMRTLAGGKWRDYGLPSTAGSSVAAEALLIDRDRGVWISTASAGIYHVQRGVSGDQTDRFRQADGLASDSIESFFEDREGNVWTASPRGIDCFRDVSVATLSKREGLAADTVTAVVAGADGAVWIGNGSTIVSWRDGKLAAIRSGDVFPGKHVTSLLEDRAGWVWAGVDTELMVREGRNFRPLRTPDHMPLGMVTGLAEDADQNVWALATGRPQKLLRIRNGQVRDTIAAPFPVIGAALAADPKDGIWLGFTNGGLARYRSGKFEIFSADEDPGPIRHVLVDPDGSVWAAAGKGLVRWKAGKRRMLSRATGLPCDSLYSAIRDNGDMLWLYASCGVIAIPSTELDRWWMKPGSPIATKLLDVFDGAQPGATPFSPPVSRSPDGLLWFANDSALQFADPGEIRGNRMPPPVRIEQISADQNSYAPEANLRLPAGTRNLQIDYTALSFSVPRKVRFRYKLEGRDESWREAGTRRQAFYTDLAPRKYQFRVIACNDDGVWNETGASWSFFVEPAYYQMAWFRWMTMGACIFGLWSIYQLRVQRIAARLKARFDERVAERIRLSSELHDTFLQSVEASKMVADHALVEAPANPVRMRSAMETLSGWLAQATADGRVALNTLRASASLQNNLAEAFQRAAEVARAAGSMEFILSVEGATRSIHPIVRDEVVRIGSEAIRAFCLCSRRGRLEVKIRYSRDLTIWVRDNGEGIERDVTAAETRHFELAGMQDRSIRIGGQLRIFNRPNSGTEIELKVPGRIAFHDPGRWRFFAKIRSVFGTADGDR